MRSAPSVITERGFGSEAAIRRAITTVGPPWPGLGWASGGCGGMQAGVGGAGAETHGQGRRTSR